MCEFSISTPRCTITAPRGNNLIESLRQTIDDADTQRFLPILSRLFPTDNELHLLTFQTLLSATNKIFENHDWDCWTILKDDTTIGLILFLNKYSHPTLLFAIHPAYRRQGYMKECLLRTIDFVTQECPIYSIYEEINQDDIASQRLLSSTGFTEVGKKDGISYYELQLL